MATMVPITSDLAGYATFWRRAVAVLAAALVLAQVPTWVLLWLMWKSP